jgi:hypothetical protein
MARHQHLPPYLGQLSGRIAGVGGVDILAPRARAFIENISAAIDVPHETKPLQFRYELYEIITKVMKL